MTIKTFALAAVASIVIAGAANATTIVAVNAAGATTSPFVLGDFGNANTNGLISTAPIFISTGVITFSPNLSKPNAGVYDGNVSGVASTPFATTSLPNRNYLVAEPNDPVNFSFSTPQTKFQLLWGSVDNYNSLSLTFTTSAGPQTIVIGGSDIAAAAGSTFPTNGSGAAFVTISDVGSFTSVSARSTQAAFEFVPGVQVPEPASIALLGAGLAGLGWARRRRAATA